MKRSQKGIQRILERNRFLKSAAQFQVASPFRSQRQLFVTEKVLVILNKTGLSLESLTL